MKTAAIALAGWLICVTPCAAWSANVVGSVVDTDSHPVNGIVITARNMAGKVFSQGTTNQQGRYEMTGLAPGEYQYRLDPGKSGFKPGSAVSYLGAKGLTINWKLSSVNMALASAHEGADEQVAGDPFGFSAGEFASLVVLTAGGVAGAVVGGYAAAGGFSSPSAPASPSL